MHVLVDTCLFIHTYIHTRTEIIRLMTVHRAIFPCQFHEYYKNDSLPVSKIFYYLQFVILYRKWMVERNRIGRRVSHKQLQRTV